MRIVHVARKPLDGTVVNNTIVHGTGGINIDGTRIAAPGENVQTNSKSPIAAVSRGIYGSYESHGCYQTRGQKLGRFPSNVVLEHLDGCERRGTVQTEGYAINRWKDGSKPFGGGTGHPYESEAVPAFREVWACVEGCPVAELDASVGERKSAGIYPSDSTARNSPHLRGVTMQGVLYEDTGGASRFYKQVGHDEPEPE